MSKNIDNNHLSGEELIHLFRNPCNSVSFNDHLKICEWCAERYRETIETILQEKINSSALFNTKNPEATNN